jgi:hypothetical protein
MEVVQLGRNRFYKICNSDQLRPFFMSVVSDGNHWLFISSNGGLTAGRKNSEHALFPYDTDDKITESYETTGSKTVVQWRVDGQLHSWEPFSDRQTGQFTITRNLYKNELGNKIIFEEINHDLNLTYAQEWCTSARFGFVKKSKLVNGGDQTRQLRVWDGLQNILPYGVGSDLQRASSNLVDAYKKNELLTPSNLGLFMLSAIIVDKAEPSEALKTNWVWSHGMKEAIVLLSNLQLSAFRKGMEVYQETDIKAEKGAYNVVGTMALQPHAEKEWMLVADVGKTMADVVRLEQELLVNPMLGQEVLEDVEKGSQNLLALTGAADGKQFTQDDRRNTRHYANVLFNIMRGGIFDNDYYVEKKDFLLYLEKANKKVYKAHKSQLMQLEEGFQHNVVMDLAKSTKDTDFKRLCMEYLPLKFSRRHGDPSRPWNKFSINTQSEVDGSKILDYQGNWRDIFQNWEALAQAYPKFIHGMLAKFLNASTFDGYNPYRVTKDGFDWETIEPDDPWSYIGYWGDHQIIYLLKFLEFSENHFPGSLGARFHDEVYVYAHVPYRIKAYGDILGDPKNTIDFLQEEDREIGQRKQLIGADGALLKNRKGHIHKVSFMEKLLASFLAKCSNFIPNGGIWMNTQRPEWNDANNALVGNGVSMVTLYYMRRFATFLQHVVQADQSQHFTVSSELKTYFLKTYDALVQHSGLMLGPLDAKGRRMFMDTLGMAAGHYRHTVYENGFSGEKDGVSREDINQFLQRTLKWLDHTIAANRREDGLYHAYNLLEVEKEGGVSLAHLSEMLEGQVAVLSSGYLNAQQSLEVLKALRDSALYRKDQHSYILYPNKQLPRFTERNNIPSQAAQRSKLIQKLLLDGNTSIVEKDVLGGYHFNGNFNNANSLKSAMQVLDASYQPLVSQEREYLLELFEDVFDHKSFTGRSGTFYGYEGLGSIYWHMVSKLALAAQECFVRGLHQGADESTLNALAAAFHEINEGIGVHKSPAQYGAFPTDPYSHTPAGKGAQQPGMTGQVKEDILVRFGELGLVVRGGCLAFAPKLLHKSEFLVEQTIMPYLAIGGVMKTLVLDKNTLGFTYCQVPIVYELGKAPRIKVYLANETLKEIQGAQLDADLSSTLFARKGVVVKIRVTINESDLK